MFLLSVIAFVGFDAKTSTMAEAAADCSTVRIDTRAFRIVSRDGPNVVRLGGGRSRVGLRDASRARQLANLIVECNGQLFGLGNSDAAATAVQVVAASRESRERLIRVHVAQSFRGLDVGGGVQLTFAGSDLVSVRSSIVSDISVSTTARIDQREAISGAQLAAGLSPTVDAPVAKLKILEIADRPILVWSISHRGDRDHDSIIDAQTGAVISSESAIHATSGKIIAEVPGVADPVYLPRLTVKGSPVTDPTNLTTVTSSGSSYTVSIVGIPKSAKVNILAELKGANTSVTWHPTLDREDPLAFLIAPANDTTAHINWAEHDDSPEQEHSNVYYRINKAHAFFSWDKDLSDPSNASKDGPLVVRGLDYSMPVLVNDPTAYRSDLGCIGLWSSNSKSISLAGPDTLDDAGEPCGKVGLNNWVISHEYGHAAVHFIGKEFVSTPGFTSWDPGLQLPALSEALAEYFAAAILGSGGPLEQSPPLRADTDWVTNDILDNGAHANMHIIGGFLWDFRKSINQTTADRILVQGLRCFQGLKALVDLEPMEILILCMAEEDALLAGKGADPENAPHLEELCDAANAHALSTPVCYGKTEQPITKLTLDRYYNPNPIPSEWQGLPGLVPWTNKKYPGHLLRARATVHACRDSVELVSFVEWRERGSVGTWNSSSSLDGEFVELEVTSTLDLLAVDNGVYDVRVRAKCTTDDGYLETGTFEQFVVRDSDFYEITVKANAQEVTLPFDFQITDPNTNGAFKLEDGARLNCQDNGIAGRLGWPSGIAVIAEKSKAAHLKNCTIVAFNIGYWVKNAQSSSAENLDIAFLFGEATPLWGKKRPVAGIRMVGGSSAIVKNNTLGLIGREVSNAWGIDLSQNGGKSFVLSNVVSTSRNTIGIRVRSSAELAVNGNDIRHLSTDAPLWSHSGIHVSANAGASISLTNNTIKDLDRAHGVLAKTGGTGSFVSISANMVSEQDGTNAKDSAIRVMGRGMTVTGNIIEHVRIGISSFNGVETMISGNRVTDSERAVMLIGGWKSKVIDNPLLEGSVSGIELDSDWLEKNWNPATFITIEGNDEVRGSGTCIRVEDGYAITIRDNRIVGSCGAGVEVVDQDANAYGPLQVGVIDNIISVDGHGIIIGDASAAPANFFTGIRENHVDVGGLGVIVFPNASAIAVQSNPMIRGEIALEVHSSGNAFVDNIFEGTAGGADVADLSPNGNIWSVEPGDLPGHAITDPNVSIGGNHYAHYIATPESSGYLPPLVIGPSTDSYPLP